MIDSSDQFLDFAIVPDDVIALQLEQIEEALQLSARLPQIQQWQAYLNTLALLSFEQWLTDRDRELSLNKEQYTNISESVCRLQVGGFKLCLLVRGILDDDIIAIPREAIESPDALAHLYIIVTVDEEHEQAFIEGVIRYDRLTAHHLSLQSDERYEVPLTWFDRDPNRLLLYLRCLDPTAIQLPTRSPYSLISPTHLTQSVINVGLWLQGELDDLSQRLAWILLSEPAVATVSFRSLPTLDIIIQELRERGTPIPETARGAYRIFSLGEDLLQLYALTWLLEDTGEWSLLLILGMQSENSLPEGLKLQIGDTQCTLLERIVQIDSDETYLYARVVGSQDEQFSVTLTLNNGESLTFPSFVFIREQ